MARLEARLPENADGELFVDASCIDCDTCRQVAPASFARSPRGLSFVHRQPATEAERHRALMAVVACPTASIGAVHPIDATEGVRAFPERVAGDVYYCGFASASSYGASSYLIRRAGGNVLVDSPRAARPLLRRLRELGGARLLFLTHRDDVADQRKLRDELGCERVIHADDVARETEDVERKLEGREPVTLAEDLLAIPVPGHTRGSTALLYRDEFLFTGDHLWWSEERGSLHASRAVCWYSWPEQVRSVERLLDFSFEWVLPGHGARHHAASAEAMRRELARLVAEAGGE